jgi:hypothetical protein
MGREHLDQISGGYLVREAIPGVATPIAGNHHVDLLPATAENNFLLGFT